MWVPKWQRDRAKGVDSPMPTQVVSNEEFIPRPQNDRQKQVEDLIGTLAAEKSRKLGMDRRAYLASSMGLATAFLAQNMVYGNFWDVAEAETLEPAVTEEKWPKGEYFIIDVQSHFTNGLALGFRNLEFMRNMGFKLKGGPEAYSFPNFMKEMFFDSETSMLVISGVPGKENNRDASGKVLEREARTPGMQGKVLPSWVMAERRKRLTTSPAHSERSPKVTALPITTGTASRMPPTTPLSSNKWSGKSRPIRSIHGSGIATPTRVVPVTDSGWMMKS